MWEDPQERRIHFEVCPVSSASFNTSLPGWGGRRVPDVPEFFYLFIFPSLALPFFFSSLLSRILSLLCCQRRFHSHLPYGVSREPGRFRNPGPVPGGKVSPGFSARCPRASRQGRDRGTRRPPCAAILGRAGGGRAGLQDGADSALALRRQGSLAVPPRRGGEEVLRSRQKPPSLRTHPPPWAWRGGVTARPAMVPTGVLIPRSLRRPSPSPPAVTCLARPARAPS